MSEPIWEIVESGWWANDSRERRRSHGCGWYPWHRNQDRPTGSPYRTLGDGKQAAIDEGGAP